MELKVWAPFFDLDKEWRLDLPRLFGEGPFRPVVDVVAEDGELVVTAELPGIDPGDIEVTLEGDVLHIEGVKSEVREVDEGDRYLKERSYGKFHRRIAMPEGVSPERMTAHFDKGVLTVKVGVPEGEAKEPRTIPIEVSS